ncbi:DUF3618 domain-containing protein [Tsukamurella spumae]|uniref:DUF3618 domain-containing protein n=1 Tax=Tsukamurella spumae TaxID=44753 RepID=A0A846WX48_9ACTN|nr:DUF3618 domain-containing protein [Tsukamurella spumae]NKY17767.1 DUF3618 domain-containing protein [Tsukamurella spumae]
MARDTESIERDIERAREQLAATLDQLGERADPRKLAEQAQQSVIATVTKPPVLAAAAGAVVLVIVVVGSRFARARREKQIIRALAEGRISI